MYNYAALSDIEFEDLCKDIMERLLNVELRSFARGRDGGVDFTDNVNTYSIIIQVKHYINSPFSTLKSSLKKEREKLNQKKPKKFFICCSKRLTPSNIKDIYDIFSSYMKSDKHIITLAEIDDFLHMQENNDIVRKHFKLWLASISMLTDIFSSNVFIDSDVLVQDIKRDNLFFVQTSIFDKCIDCLEKNRILMIIGAPGVGKTVTSEMLVLRFVEKGYRVRFSTNADISNIKSSIALESETKEIILLDDCLGQCYFTMKETQETELLSLIKYIYNNPNKVLILNSRVTIFNEAKERTDKFKIYIEGRDVKVHTINVNEISIIEKARIFYNHLYFKKIPHDYFQSIRNNREYLKIVRHPNYMPRIIDYVTNYQSYIQVPANEYSHFIISSLSHPDDIWKNEFERRLSQFDRAFMNTLYSLTDTTIEMSTMQKCFNKRLESMDQVDKTINNFIMVLKRLNNSVISIFDKKGIKHIGVINPSVNDYLKTVIDENELELHDMQKSVVHINQINRCYGNNDRSLLIDNLFNNGEILKIDFDSDIEKVNFIVNRICKKMICADNFKHVVENYFTLKDSFPYNYFNSKSNVIDALSSEPLYSYYDIKTLSNMYGLSKEFYNVYDIQKLIKLINSMTKLYSIEGDSEIIEQFSTICIELVNEEIESIVDVNDVTALLEEYNIGEFVNRNTTRNHVTGEYVVDMECIIDELTSCIEEDIKNSIESHVQYLPVDIREKISISKFDVSIDEYEIEKVVDSYIQSDIYDADEYRGDSSSSDFDLDYIFNREFDT